MIRLRLPLRRDKADLGYSWQRPHFDLDKLSGLFRNFVSYENIKCANSTTSRSPCTWLAGVFPNGRGSQPTA
jgi:hypothetical protein